MASLEDFQANLDSLPAALRRSYATMRELDNSLQVLLRQNEERCEQEIHNIKQGIESGRIKPDPSTIRFSEEAIDEQKHCVRISDEKVAMAIRAYDIVDTQIQQLDQFLRKYEELRQEKEAAAAGGTGSNADGSTRSTRGESSKGGRKKTRQAVAEPPSVNLDLPVDPNEPTYCFCNQVSFGEMVACDNPDCKIEWFHFGCVGLKEQPKGKWYCSTCAGIKKYRKGK